MSALPSDIIHNCIFKFIQNQSNIANYPQEHLDDIIDSFPIKLMRPELDMSNVPKPRTRRHLRKLLYMCSPTEIFFVGW